MIKVDFAQRIRESRIIRGLTQAGFAQAIGKTRRTIAGWEKGVKKINAKALTELCLIFDVSSDYLLGLSNDATIKVFIRR